MNYIYDAAGNVTNDGVHSYTYDAENRVVSVDGGATAQYKYDHQNRRVSKIIGSSWTHYIWQGSQVIAQHDATTAYTANPTYQVSSARLDYLYSGSQMISSRERASSVGSWSTKYYLSDRLSTRLVLDTSGNVLGRQAHLPFGEHFAESGTQEKHHFTSYERDGEIGTDYATNRQYEQRVGRFNRVDPVPGSIKTPRSLNRYAYVHNDPINLSDPLGLFCGPGTFYNWETGKCEDLEEPGEPVDPFSGGHSPGDDGMTAVDESHSESPAELGGNLPKAKFSQQKFEDCARQIWGGDPNTAEGRLRNETLALILSQMHYVRSAAQAGGYGVYFDYTQTQDQISTLLTESGIPGIQGPQIAGYTYAHPNIIYFASDVFTTQAWPNGILSGSPGDPQYEYGSAVLFHEIGNWISDRLNSSRRREGGPAGDRDEGSRLEQCCMAGGYGVMVESTRPRGKEHGEIK